VSSLDLNSPPNGHSYSISVDKDETAAERGVRLFKDVVLFLAALVAVGVVLWLCVRGVTDPTATPDEHKWSMSVLAATVGGLIGYLVRK